MKSKAMNTHGFKVGDKVLTTRATGGMMNAEIESFTEDGTHARVKLFFEDGVIGQGIRRLGELEKGGAV